MKTLKLPIIIMLAGAGLSSVASAQRSFAQATGNQINIIDAATGVSSNIYTASGSPQYNGLAYGAATGLLYMVDTANPGSQRLLAFNPANPAAGLVASSILTTNAGGTLSSPVLGATIDASTGLYLGITQGSNLLRAWNLTGGNAVWQATLNLGSTGWAGLQLGDLTMDNSGALWISSTNAQVNQSALLRYSSLAAAQAGQAPTVFNLSTSAGLIMNGIGYDSATDTLYGYQAEIGDRYFTINKTTGAVETVINTTDPAFAIGGDFSDAFPTPVPEPAAALLGALGLCGLVLRRRK